MKINYIKNVREDKRLSMDEYVDNLISYQKIHFKDLDINEHSINIGKIYKFLPKKWKLRFARYIHYPLSLRKLPIFDLTHVVDHSYAHLVKKIKSKVKILTVNDLIPLVFEKKKLKDMYNPTGEGTDKNLKYLFRYSVKHFKYFDRIIAISENTKKDILKFSDCDESKISVIHTNVTPPYFNNSPVNKDEICLRYNIPVNKKKILISGNGFYKNHLISFKVLENLLKENLDVCLIWIGHKGDISKIDNKMIDRIIKIPIIKKEELPSIYKVCDVVLSPSLYEGLGLVNLEAMKCGIPVVTSNTSSIPEIVGNDAISCDPMDSDFMTKKIKQLIEDKNFYDNFVDYGFKRSKIFDYDEMHDKIVKLYESEFSRIINNAKFN